MNKIVRLVNSFSVIPILSRRQNGILRIALSEESKSKEYPVVRQSWLDLIQEIRERNINIEIESTTEAYSYADVMIKPSINFEKLFTKPKGLWLALDGVEDGRNLGMILRTASFYGVNGVLLKTKDGTSATLNQEIMMNSCGGIESLDYSFCNSFTEVQNLLKEKNFSVVIADVDQGQDMVDGSECNERTLIILGNEYNGLSKEAADLATHRICIPFAPSASVNCLNVANCTSVIIDRFRKKIYKPED